MLHLIKQWARKLWEPKKDVHCSGLFKALSSIWTALLVGEHIASAFPLFFSLLSKVTATSHLMFPLYSN